MESSVFALSSDECELLVAFESSPSLEKLAAAMGRDISNISRALGRIAGKLPVIEKQRGRWVLTERGRQLNQHTRDAIQYQRSLFQKQAWLRIGTNREFAARILGPHLKTMGDLFPETQFRICAFESGTEKELLDGNIDISIDCERPFSPEVSYKIAVVEPIVIVCSPAFKKANLKAVKDGSFFGLPHLLCDRLSPDRILQKSENKLNVLSSFNDIATTRAACEQGVGWALLPRYTVDLELKTGKLVEIEAVGAGESKYGVWWLRGRRYLAPSAHKLRDWIAGLNL
jgi:DNA-binding transcriptional LysR family regulator